MRAFNTNIASLQAQRRLQTATSDLVQTFQRLSSGLRINRASDDAAGLAVSSGLNTNARVYGQAVRNVNDAISMYSIAEGATSELSMILTRLQELASQSANGVLSNDQRTALDDEAQALRNEFNRIIEVTEFNSLPLLDGEQAIVSIQTGYDAVDLEFADLASAFTDLVPSFTADGTFEARVSYASTGIPVKIETADVTGDGNQDMISLQFAGNQLLVYSGNGDGTFKAPVAYVTDPGSRGLAARDVTGDGVLDFVVGGSNTVSVFVGNGNGTYKARISYAAGPSSQDLILADVTGDGIVDAISSSSSDSTVHLLAGNGDGTFKASTSLSVGAGAFTIQATDVTGDSVRDLIVAASTPGVIQVFAGNGNGTFKASASYGGNFARQVLALDVTGDGVLDLVTSEAAVLVGNGDGTFRARRSYAVGTGPWSVFAGDMTGDGVLDLLTADSASSTLSLLAGNGDGTYQARVSFATLANPAFAIAADLNGDSVLDLIGLSTNNLNVLLGNGSMSETLEPFSLLTQEDALSAIDRLATIQENVSASLGDLGSSVSRLNAAANTLTTTRENYLRAASQILDADVAEESSRLVRLGILQQAASAVLAQANQLPELALGLLVR